MKILHTADWHLGKRLQEYSRLEEQKEVLQEIVDIAEAEAVDLVLLAGDIFDTFNPNHEAVELLYKTLRKLSNNGQRPIIAISGNHDSTQFIEAPDPLARELGIIFYSRYDSTIPTGTLESGVQLTQSESGFIELKLPAYDYPIRILLAPYANELLLKTYLGDGDREEEFRELMGKRWRALADTYCDSTGVNLFIGHFFFMKEGEKPEAEPESERPILHVGGTQALYTHIIPPQIQYAALGHLHRYHAVGKEPCPIVYSSSLLSYSFSEAAQEKQVVIIKVDPGKPVQYKPIGLTKGKPLYRETFDSLESSLTWLEKNPHCYVELTYITEQAIDASTRKALMKAHDGIVNLIPQIKNPIGQESLSLKVEDLEKDMLSLFQLYYKSERGLDPNDELLDLFKEVISVDPSNKD
ncbi:metallophosphoesterase family protein [Mongoliitalea daihaiensis]|uniref:metallophosphoesterase family protein n=1 Tax=Mongoliitalea daihaiensis TaxID=2782006 RepID=UPI001F316A9D|nr:exonuclease SbcCD subunit D [Mongoliitalea daihaiensis]UJP66550.1 exonuclease SbcCD subunit D [Mongoliitalea daihaiensis]